MSQPTSDIGAAASGPVRFLWQPSLFRDGFPPFDSSNTEKRIDLGDHGALYTGTETGHSAAS